MSTTSSDLKERVRTLGEIKRILSAMKNLSIIEMNKVSRFLGVQNENALTIENALADFEHFYLYKAETPSSDMLYLILGSERGFCGGFNESILNQFMESTKNKKSTLQVILVGRKLASKLGHQGDHLKVEKCIPGPSSAEEIEPCIKELVATLTKFPKKQWTLIYHESSDKKEIQSVCPFQAKVADKKQLLNFAPLINLDPETLYLELFEQYLFAVLYRAFFISFLSENQERLRHMEGALKDLDKHWNEMRKIENRLRQEEITEELEMIMLNVTGS